MSSSGETDEIEAGAGTALEVPLERLEVELISWAGHLAAATAKWLTWLGEYDRRKGWEQWGCRSAAHWLSWKCGMSPGTARTHVRVARSLQELPLIAESFGRGELSFSKVRALCRLPRPLDEAEMIQLARTATASQLDRIVAGCCTALDHDNDPTRPNGRARFGTRHLRDGRAEVFIVVSTADAERIEHTVDKTSQTIVDQRDESVPHKEWVEHLGGWDHIQSRTATALLTNTLEHPGPDPIELVVDITATPKPDTSPSTATSRGSAETTNTPTENTDSETETELEVVGRCAQTGRHLPATVIQRLGCDAVIATITETTTNTSEASEGDGPGIGHRTRVVPPWLRRQLERRDHHQCRFPGCTNTRWLHAHHIIHWTNHGPTNLNNLLLLCSFHHHLLHEGSWTIQGPATGAAFITPTGHTATIPNINGSTKPITNRRPTTTKTLTALWAAGETYNHHYAVSVIAEGITHHQRQHHPADPEHTANQTSDDPPAHPGPTDPNLN